MVMRIGRGTIAAVIACALLGLGACSRTEQYLATGAAIGVGGGAIVAATTGGAIVGGAIVGGALGTGAGYIAAH